jgi:hypothetical protein
MLSEDVIKRARTSLLADMKRSAESRLEFAARLSEWIGAGDWRLFYIHRARIEQVTLADVRRVAGTYLHPSNRTVGVLVPRSLSMVTVPAAPSLADEYARLERGSATTNEKGVTPGGGSEARWDGSPEHLVDALRVETLANTSIPRVSSSCVSVPTFADDGQPQCATGDDVARKEKRTRFTAALHHVNGRACVTRPAPEPPLGPDPNAQR